MNTPDPEQTRERYIRLIRQKGITSTQTEITARKLGIDVDAILEEREREELAGKVIAIDLDLGSLALDTNGMPSEDGFTPWNCKVVPSATVIVDLPGLGIYGVIPPDDAGEITVAEVLTAGVRLILRRLREAPDKYRYTLPWGIKDIGLERMVYDDSKKRWMLMGGRKLLTLKRTIQSMNPSRSIDLSRKSIKAGQRIHAEPWPELEWVWIKVERWPSGTLRVVNVFDHPEDSGPIHAPTHPHLPHTFTMKYPCSGEFQWDVWETVTPAAHFLRNYSLRQAGKLAKDADSYGVEVILCDYSKPRPATDPRASIRSGIEGPAPLPYGCSWPVCPNCCASPSFWESIDFRDTPFSHLLPGTSLSLFICDNCLDKGEWSACTTTIWLPADNDVELVSKCNPSPILAARQWMDRERSRDDIPDALSDLIDAGWPNGLPCGFFFVAPGTKAGGYPDYLQEDPILFGADGCLMEYIGQFVPPESSWFDGKGYLYHSTTTGETVAELQAT